MNKRIALISSPFVRIKSLIPFRKIYKIYIVKSPFSLQVVNLFFPIFFNYIFL